MTRLTKFLFVGLLIVSGHSALAQQRSVKRGIGWDEKTQALTDAVVGKMAPGVAWVYNWGEAPLNAVGSLATGGDMVFIPMCWNGNFNETKLRSYLSTHPDVSMLLGFNEPNFSAQSNMTPSAAASAWPRLEAIAQEYNLQLVAPALNFTGEYVGGRMWSPYEWLDEFFRLYPSAQVDYLALHCYMNWYSSNTWFATEYFYKDLYTPGKDAYGQYPNIVNYLDAYKEAHGHFPQMYLTEFCAWEGNKDGFVLNADSQIDQMTQKVQQLEQSDLVAGYAWFMGNANASAYPYMSLFESNTSSSDLSTLGKVYVYMSSFDTEKYYVPGETILAKDYIDASRDNQQVKLRPNTETGSTIPLQVQWGGSSWMAWQVDIAEAGDYALTLHIQSSAAASYRLYRNATGAANKLQDTKTLSSTNGQWTDVTTQVTLPAGQYSLLLYNMSTTPVLLNSLQLQTTTGISDAVRLDDNGQMTSDNRIYDLQGRRLDDSSLSTLHSSLKKGIYIINGKKYIIN